MEQGTRDLLGTTCAWLPPLLAGHSGLTPVGIKQFTEHLLCGNHVGKFTQDRAILTP